jgi:nucleoside-diphosphate-sugar epimerase
MTVLLTGATGFVGNALYRELVCRGYDLTCVFRRGYGEGRLENQFRDCTRHVVENLDGNTRWTLCLTGVDQVVHLAGIAHVSGREGPAGRRREFFEVNYAGTCNLAVQAARQGVKRFVFMSSILVNGSQSSAGKWRETHRPDPQNAYAEAKADAERFLEKISAGTGMEVVILRPPLVYGPGVKGNFLKLLDLVHAGVPMPFKKISNNRSVINLKNLVDAVCLCLSHEKAGNQTFVVSDGQDLSTPRLITKIAAAMDRPLRLFAVPERIMKTGLGFLGQSAVYDRLWGTLQVDPSKICTRLGWTPQVTVDQGIEDTVTWYLDCRRHHRRFMGRA